MKYRAFVTALAIASLALVDAQTVNAWPKYLDTPANFNAADTWLLDGCGGSSTVSAPGSTDIAIVCEGIFATVTADQTIAGLEVMVNALVVFENTDGRVLTINSGYGKIHEIEGVIFLSNPTNGNHVLRFTSSAILGGDGRIVGEDNDARLEIDGAAVKLTSHITIEGHMKITENAADSGGIFENKGLVEANGLASGDVFLIEEIFLQDGMDGVYRLNGDADTTLTFASTLKSAVNLNSDLKMLSDGTVNIAAAFATTGDLVWTDGTLDAATTAATAKFAHAYMRGG